MKTFTVCLVMGLLILLVLSPVVAQEGPATGPGPKKGKQEKKDAPPPSSVMLEAHKYFPMEKGNWWEYQSEDSDGEDEERERCEVIETTRDGCRLLSHSDYGTPEESRMELVLRVKDGFITREYGEESDIWKEVKLPPVVGEKWTGKTDGSDPEDDTSVRCHVAAITDVETPAGKFSKAVCVVSRYGSGDEDQTTITEWYAPGVGMVKQVYSWGSSSSVKMLVKYHVKRAGDAVIGCALAASRLVVIASVKAPESKEEKPGEDELKKREQKPAEQQVGKPVQVRFVVERVLKGKLSEKEIVVAVKQGVAKGKWVLFLGTLAKEGYPQVGPALPAEEDIVKKLDSILSPPRPGTLAERLAQADYVIVARAIVREDRGEFNYWVFEIEKVLKGDRSRTHIDVLPGRGGRFAAGERYILTLKAGAHHGRRLHKLLGDKLDAYTVKRMEEYKKVLEK